jgi:hypothetical protein
MKASTAYPSKYIKASDLQGKTVRMTIADVKMEEVARDEPEKPVMYFEGKTKAMCLNKTNFNACVKLYGDETDDWKGKPILVYPTETDYQGERVDCLRLKAAPVVAGKGKTPEPPPPENEDANPLDDSNIPF